MTNKPTDKAPGVETRGAFEPKSWEAVEARFEAFGPTARTVVREIARAMAFDREEYGERVTSEVVETARQALFAETLVVQVADREAFESWRSECSGEVHVAGSDTVSRVAWHVSPTGEAVAATFENEPDAAVGTVRRMAFNRLYRNRLLGTERDE